MRVLGIVCSPRKGGNTEILVHEALEGAREAGAQTELVRVAGLSITPCDACEACISVGECIIQDDMQKIYPKLLASDGIIVGTPVYIWTVSAQAKLIMDRTFCYRRGELEGKFCGGIAVAGRRGTMNALTVLNMFFLGKGMRPVAYGVNAYGRDVGSVRTDQRGMRDAREMGMRIAKREIRAHGDWKVRAHEQTRVKKVPET